MKKEGTDQRGDESRGAPATSLKTRIGEYQMKEKDKAYERRIGNKRRKCYGEKFDTKKLYTKVKDGEIKQN